MAGTRKFVKVWCIVYCKIVNLIKQIILTVLQKVRKQTKNKQVGMRENQDYGDYSLLKGHYISVIRKLL